MAKLGNVLEPAEVGVVMLWDESSGVFRPEAAFGYDLGQMRDMGLRIGEGITSKAFDENAAYLVNDADHIAKGMADLRPPNRRPVKFTQGDLSFVQTVAELIAIAIDRAQLEEAAIRDAKRVDRLRSEVMAALSHELRTPLAAIKGYSTALFLEDALWTDDKRR